MIGDDLFGLSFAQPVRDRVVDLERRGYRPREVVAPMETRPPGALTCTFMGMRVHFSELVPKRAHALVLAPCRLCDGNGCERCRGTGVYASVVLKGDGS